MNSSMTSKSCGRGGGHSVVSSLLSGASVAGAVCGCGERMCRLSFRVVFVILVSCLQYKGCVRLSHGDVLRFRIRLLSEESDSESENIAVAQTSNPVKTKATTPRTLPMNSRNMVTGVFNDSSNQHIKKPKQQRAPNRKTTCILAENQKEMQKLIALDTNNLSDHHTLG